MSGKPAARQGDMTRCMAVALSRFSRGAHRCPHRRVACSVCPGEAASGHPVNLLGAGPSGETDNRPAGRCVGSLAPPQRLPDKNAARRWEPRPG